MTIRTQGGGGDFTAAPPGMHVARLFKLIDLGTHYHESFERWMRLGVFAFELPRCLLTDGPNAGKPMSVQKRYTLSHHERANLRADLESWYGKRFSTAELDRAGGFALDKLIGRAAMLNIVHSDDGKYANIKSINPLPDEIVCPPPVNEPLVFSIDPFDAQAFARLSEKEKEMVESSRERGGGRASHGAPAAPPPMHPYSPESANQQMPIAPATAQRERTPEEATAHFYRAAQVDLESVSVDPSEDLPF